MNIAQRILSRLDDFPTLPTIYTTLSEIMTNPYSTADDAAKVISSDQASASKILKTANSSIYGFRTKIDSVSKAIFYIGFEEVKNLILAMSIIDLFKKSDLNVAFNPVELWKHSIGVGVICRILGQVLGIKNIENYFVAGILHDVGKLFFIKYYDVEYAEVLNYALENKETMRNAEHKVLGITHNIAGELIAEKWKLPFSIKNAVRHHHNGLVGGEPELLAGSVHIANITAKMMDFGSGGGYLIEQPNKEVWEKLDLPNSVFTGLAKKIYSNYAESIKIFLLT